MSHCDASLKLIVQREGLHRSTRVKLDLLFLFFGGSYCLYVWSVCVSV